MKGQRLCRHFENETIAARFYGADYVIAGRMVDLINSRLVDALNEEDQHERHMKLWAIRAHIVNTHRRIR